MSDAIGNRTPPRREQEVANLRKVESNCLGITAAQEGYLRVVDESGEDYSSLDDYFVPVQLAPAVIEEFVSSA